MIGLLLAGSPEVTRLRFGNRSDTVGALEIEA
jgi:hypothetical protein